MELDSTALESSPDTAPGLKHQDIFAIGEELDEAYEIVGVLGQGGMGQVFEAHDHLLARTVAIKASWPHISPTGLRDECRALAALHTHAVPGIYGMGRHRGITFAVMERVPGQTLAAYTAAHLQRGHMDLDEVLGLLSGVARALASVHDAGLAHRDLKPTNIMLAPDERTVLLDFGLFVSYGNATGRTVLCGSPRYMAPESITESVRPGQEHLLDIYALGIISYMLLTRRHPFPQKATNQILWRHVYEEPLSVREWRDEVPGSLDRLVSEMLAKDPMDRPFSAHGLASELAVIRTRLRD